MAELKVTTKKLVLYHANCLDGYAAAWAAWKALGSSAKYKPVKHYTAMPKFAAGTELYILDFCYSADELIAAAKLASKIIILDHHISAEKDILAYQQDNTLPENIDVTFVQAHSGCMITWQYFHKTASPPVVLQHIEDNDLWLHKLSDTKAVCKALYCYLPLNFSKFERLTLAKLKQEGRILQKQHEQNISRLLTARHAVVLNNIKGLAVNAPAMSASDLGHELADLSGTFGLTYIYNGKRQRYECGLRSIGEFDVSILAAKFGGGGHKNASGFSVDQTTFLTFFES